MSSTTKKQSIKQAVALATSGESRSLRLAAFFLDGLPVGGWGQTSQAMRQIEDELPRKAERSYTIEQFIDALYTVDYADRYRARLGGAS